MINKAIEQLHSDDEVERCEAIEILIGNTHIPAVSDEIIKAFYDKCYLVRCDAYAVFCDCQDKVVMAELIKRLKSERSLVAKTYLLYTLSSIIKKIGCDNEIKEQIYSCYEKEHNKKVLISYWELLYIIENDTEYINKILYYLNDENNHIRHNVINTLFDINDEGLIKIIIDKYIERLRIEDTLSIKEKLKEQIQQFNNVIT